MTLKEFFDETPYKECWDKHIIVKDDLGNTLYDDTPKDLADIQCPACKQELLNVDMHFDFDNYIVGINARVEATHELISLYRFLMLHEDSDRKPVLTETYEIHRSKEAAVNRIAYLEDFYTAKVLVVEELAENTVIPMSDRVFKRVWPEHVNGANRED